MLSKYQKIVVPDMPSELSAEVNGSLDSIIVKWEPPLNENGILLGYQVLYQGEEVYPTRTCSCCYSIYVFYSLFAIQVSGKNFVLKDGPFVVNVSAEQTMVVMNKLITGLTYTFSVRYQINLILT